MKKIMKLKKHYQINLNDYKELNFNTDRVWFSTCQFVLHKQDIFVIAVCKEDATKIKIVQFNKDRIVTHSVHNIFKTNYEYADSVINSLKMVSHNDDLLIFVSEKNKTDQNIPKEIIYFKDYDISNPQTITYQNTIEPKKDTYGKTYATIQKIGNTDSDIFPIILDGYNGFNLGQQIALLKINFDNLSAKWQTEKQKELIKYKKEKYVFDAVQYKNGKTQYFSIGDSFRYKKFGMCGKIHLGETINKKNEYKFKTIYNCEYDKKSSKLFGRTAIFTLDLKYLILKPAFLKHDPWGDGRTEKLYNLDKNELIDLELPRGFSKHTIIKGNENSFLLLGKNSKKENIISILEKE